MAKTVITPEIAQFISDNYLKMSSKQIADKFGFSRGPVLRFLQKNDLKVPKHVLEQWRIEAMTGRTTFTEAEDDFIKNNYLKMPIKTLGHKIGRSYTGVMGRLKAFDLEIPKEVIQRNKNTSYYPKGHVPANKGKKLEEFMDAETIKKFKANQYKKGQLPHNTLPVGTEVQRIDKRTGNSYTMIKLSGKRKLQYKHRVIWEQHYGTIPKGYNVVFKDGNTSNSKIENLELISNTKNMYRNSRHNYPEEIIPSLVLTKKIEHKLNTLNNG